MAKTIGSILVGVGLDTKQFVKDLKNFEYSIKRTATKLKGYGTDMSTAISAPIVAGAALAVKAFAEEENAIIKMNSAIKANGKNVNLISGQYKSFASQMQEVTVVEDDAVIAALQLAESMKLANPKEAVQGAIGLSRAFGIDLNTALKATAKGMNGQWTALQRLIPSIKLAGTDAEKAALFQNILNDSFKLAQDETTSTSGSLLQLKNTLSDLSEEFGGIIADYIKPFIEKIRETIKYLKELSPETKQSIVKFAALAASVGPVLFIFGKLIESVAGLAGALRLMTTASFLNPFAAIATAIGFVYWKWDEFSLKLRRDFAMLRIDAFSLAEAFKYLTSGDVQKAGIILSAADAAKENLRKNYKTIFAEKTAGSGSLKDGETIPFLSQVNDSMLKVTGSAKKLKEEVDTVFKGLGDTVTKAAKGSLTWLNDKIAEIQKNINENALGENGLISAIKEMVGYEEKVKSISEKIEKIKDDIKQATIRGGERGVGNVDKIPTTPIKALKRQIAQTPENSPAMEALKAQLEELKIIEAENRGKKMVDDINDSLTNMANNGLAVAAEGFANMFATIATGGNLGDAFKGMLGGLMEVLEEFGRAAIKAGIAALGIEAAIKGIPGGAYLAIAGGIALIAFAKIAQAKIAKQTKIPGYAAGGIFGQESLIRVGEYPGASSNPEVVAPLDKLKDMLRLNNSGMQLSIVIDSRLQGSDLRQSIKRTDSRFSRL